MASLGRVRRHSAGMSAIFACHDCDYDAGIILARSRAAGRTRSAPPCRRRRAIARRTTASAVSADAVSAHTASVIATSRPDRAAEHPVGPGGIDPDQRDQCDATAIERPWIRFSESLPRSRLRLSICSTAGTRRFDPGRAVSFRTRHLFRLCTQSLHLSARQPRFARL